MSLELASKTSGCRDQTPRLGKVPPLEQAKAQVAEAGARATDLAQANSELSLARQRLRALWGQGAVSSPG